MKAVWTNGSESEFTIECGARPHEAVKVEQGVARPSLEWVAEEVPVAVSINGISQAVMMTTPSMLEEAVMMTTPSMLEEFAVGFALSEGIVPSFEHITDIEVQDGCREGKVVELTVSSESFWHFKQRRRSLIGRTGCGICGIESLEQFDQPLKPLPTTQTFDMGNYVKCLPYLERAERVGHRTGCTHAAVWVNASGELLGAAEDVGRHVALDKLLGLRAMAGGRDGAVFVSSRASYEMVSKAARCGVEIFFAVSAPTALAVELAQKSGMTLSAFSRQNRTTVYTRPDRLEGLLTDDSGRSVAFSSAMGGTGGAVQ